VEHKDWGRKVLLPPITQAGAGTANGITAVVKGNIWALNYNADHQFTILTSVRDDVKGKRYFVAGFNRAETTPISLSPEAALTYVWSSANDMLAPPSAQFALDDQPNHTVVDD
jgi:Tfp pilus assembly protein PilW